MRRNYRRTLWIIFLQLALTGIGGTSYAAGGGILYNAYTNDTITLRQMNPDGTYDRQIAVNLPNPQSPVWSPSGRLIALTSKGPDHPYSITLNAFVFNPTTKAITQITQYKDAVNGETSHFTLVYSKAFSTDGKRIAVVALDHAQSTSSGQTYPSLEVYDLQGNRLAIMGTSYDGTLHQGDGVDWVPNQELLIYPSLVRPNGGYATGILAVKPVQDAFSTITPQYRQLTAPQYGYVYTATGMWTVYDQDFQPAVAPNTNRVAYVREKGLLFNGQPVAPVVTVRMVDLDGANDHEIKQLPSGKNISHLSWAPDESKLVMSYGSQVISGGMYLPSLDPATVHVAFMNPDGTGWQEMAKLASDYAEWNPVGYNLLPVPTLANINPVSINAGHNGFNLTVNGTRFNGMPAAGDQVMTAEGYSQSSRVLWNGTALTTTYISPTQLKAAVPAAKLATAGAVKISVSNPSPGGGTSTSATFTINNPKPAITGFTPLSAKAGGANFTLTLTGTGFVKTSVVKWNGVALTTTYTSATQLKAAVPAAKVSKTGSATITVTNPTPGGGASAGKLFAIK